MSEKQIKRYVLSMISRESVLLPEGSMVDSHKGVFFYDPKNFPRAAAGDEIEFVCVGEVVARGVVTEIVRPDDYPKFCSGINCEGFRWDESKKNSATDSFPSVT